MRKKKKLILLFSTILIVLTYIGRLAYQDGYNFFTSNPTVLPAKTQDHVSLMTQVEGASTSAETQLPSYQISKVVDGDTLKVIINGKTKTVRVIGIDTPETVDPRKPVQCFGVQASNEVKRLLEGQFVSLESDPSQQGSDKYGRLLRYIFLADGTDLGEKLILEGFAYEYTYRVPYLYQSKYKAAQKAAMDQKKGLWADDACAPPSPPVAF